MQASDDASDERDAGPVLSEPLDSAVRDASEAYVRDAAARSTGADDSAVADAGVESGARAPSNDAASSAQPTVNTEFALTSPAFTHGTRLPDAFTCTGGDRSPPLRWTNPPAGTRSFALVLTATRAVSARANVEWVLWNIPADSRTLPEGVAAGREPSNASGVHQESPSELERAALDLGVPSGVGSSPLVPAALSPVALPSPLDLVRRPRYRGPCDEQGVSYEFTLFALDAAGSAERDLFVSPEAVEEWLKTCRGALGQASIVATYP